MAESSRGSRASSAERCEINLPSEDEDEKWVEEIERNMDCNIPSKHDISDSGDSAAGSIPDKMETRNYSVKRGCEGEISSECEDSFTTVVSKRHKRLRKGASAGPAASNPVNRGTDDDLEVLITSSKMLPKQIAMAKLLRAEGIGGILKVKFKGAYKVLIQFSLKTQAEKLLQCKAFNSEDIRSQWANHANTYGIIRRIDVDIEEEELLKEFNISQKVLSIRRLNRLNDDGQWVKSEVIRICFKESFLPSFVHAYDCRFEVEPFIFPVSQCSGCWKFGHRVKVCPTRKIVCPKCGKDHPNCQTSTYTCINCKGPHMALNKSCPVFKKEKLLREIMSDNHCTYKKALELHQDKVRRNLHKQSTEQVQNVMKNNTQGHTPYRDALLSDKNQDTPEMIDEIQEYASKCPSPLLVPSATAAHVHRRQKRKRKEKKENGESELELQEELHIPRIQEHDNTERGTREKRKDRGNRLKEIMRKVKDILFSSSTFESKVKSVVNYLVEQILSFVVEVFKGGDILSLVSMFNHG